MNVCLRTEGWFEGSTEELQDHAKVSQVAYLRVQYSTTTATSTSTHATVTTLTTPTTTTTTTTPNGWST